VKARLQGKVAIVTGAGQGIGRGIGLALSKEGASVMLAGRTASKVEAVSEEIEAAGGTAVAVACDVGSRADVESMVEATGSAFGAIDILVNNAQDSVQRPFAETTESDVELAYRTGVLGTFYAMQAALPYLKGNGGSVVNLGSSTAIEGAPTFASYAMAKEAIRGLSRVAARELGRFGIRVNVICPAAMSPAAETWASKNPRQFDHVLASIPLGRMGDAEADVGRAVVALVSDDLRYLTGSTLMLEGGRLIVG
jgi:NAD(P)-dependent dehydrogenase (short-subunit alcohol dehydrogenase family)